MFAASKTDGAVALAQADPFFDNVSLLMNTSGTNGAQNNTFIDSSTNNFTITRNGNITQGSVSPYGENWSNYFDGTGDYLSVATNTAFGFGTGAFTIECWFNTQAIPTLGGDYLFDMRTTGSQAALLAYISTSAALEVVVNGAVVITGGTVVVNRWNHFALAKSGTTTRMFLNGVQVGSSYTDNVNYVSTAPVVIASRFTAEDIYQGYISNFRIIKGTALYTANFTPSTVPLQPIAGTSLLTCKDPNIVDGSGNQFTITRFGDVITQKFGPFSGTTLTTPYYGAYFGTKTNSLSIPATTALTTFTGDFTFECWVYPTDATISTSWGIWDSRQSGATASPMILFLSPLASPVSGSWRLTYYNGTTHNGTGVVLVNQWSHVAFVRSGSTMTFYVNGVAGGTATVSGTQTGNATTNPVFIGSKDSGLAGYGTVGHISNFRIVNGTAVYTANFTPSTAPLTAITNTSLLACQSATFIDNSTNNFAITAVGSPRPTTFAPFAVTYSPLQSYTPAVFGGSMYFDGTGDYLTAPVNAAFDFGTGNFTIEAWANFASVGITQNIINNYNGTGTAGWGLQWRNDTSVYTFFSGTTTISTFAVVPALNTWNHIAVSRSGTTLRMFFNGAQVATVTNSTNLTSTLAPVIGNLFASGQGYAFPYFGYMSNVRVVKGTALYTSSFVPQNAPLTAVTNTSLLLNATNAGIYDAATLSDFETVGNAQVSTSLKKYGISSMALDGTGDYLIASSSPFNPVLAFGTGAFTIEFWFYANSSSGTRQLFDTRPVGITTTVRYMAITYLSGNLNYYTAGANPAISGGAVATGGWHYVTLTRSGTSTRLFINGIQAGSTYTDSQDYLIGVNRPIIGADGADPATANFSGNIQDLRLTRGIARYTANFTPPVAPLPTF